MIIMKQKLMIRIKRQIPINNNLKILNNKYNIKKSNRALKYIALFFILQNILFSEILQNVNDKYIWVNRESITDTTSIPFAAKAAKTLEEIKKKEEERIVSEQAPP